MSSEIKWEDIEKASQEASAIPLHNKNYVMVNQKVKAFRKVYPKGQIETDLISKEVNDKGKERVTFRAIARDEDGQLLGTGWATEDQDSTPVNRTSWVENCETGAIGRAMNACGFGIDGSYSSADELLLAESKKAEQDKKKQEKAEHSDSIYRQKSIQAYKKLGKKPADIAHDYKLKENMTDDDWKKVYSHILSANGLTNAPANAN